MRNYFQELADYFGITLEKVGEVSADLNNQINKLWVEDKANFHKSPLLVYKMMRDRPKVEECLKEIVSFSIVRGDKRILDYGCGVGSYLIPLSEMGFEVLGVELEDSEVLKFVKWRIKKRYLMFDVWSNKDENFKDGSFDVVIFYDVLEHLDNPFEVVKRIHCLLKSKGMLYMTFSPHGDMTNIKEINELCLPFLNKQFYRLDSERWLHK